MRHGRVRPPLAVSLAVLLGATVLVASGAGLSPSRERGRRVYTQTRGSSVPIIARLGDSDAEVPGEILTCADCHGLGGKGSIEGGVAAPDIRAATLARASRRSGTLGRERPGFERGSLEAAITKGIDSAGNPLHPAMPRYRMASRDLEDLLDYMEVVGSEQAPGVTADEITIGAVLPLTGRVAEAGNAIRETLSAFFDAVNSRNGVHGRRVRFEAADGDADGGAREALRSLESSGVFALVANLVPGEMEAAAISEELEQLGLPLIGPVGISLHRKVPPNPYVFHLLPGVDDQVKALVSHALADPSTAVALAAGAGNLGDAGRKAFELEMSLHGRGSATVVPIPSDAGRVMEVVEALRAVRPDVVIVVGSPRQVLGITVELREEAWHPRVLSLAALAGKQVLSLPQEAAGGVVLAYPGPLPAEARQAFAAFSGFLSATDVQQRYVAFQLVALAAAQTLTEGLKRTGRELTREGLVKALEGFRDFPTALALPLSFGPNLRTGSRTTNLVWPDPSSGRFRPVDLSKEHRAP